MDSKAQSAILSMPTYLVNLNMHEGHRFNKINVSNVNLKDLLNYNIVGLFIHIREKRH